MNRTDRKYVWIAALAFLLAFGIGALSGCGTMRRGEPLYGPLPLESASLQRGQIVFMKHCHQCHPIGSGGYGPALNNKPLTGPVIRMQVRLGLWKMPGFPEHLIDKKDMTALVDYMAALRKHGK